MAKFLNTSATNYFLEELIKNARERVILISPFLKLNDRVKELLADKNRLKIDVRIIYGKSELQPEEIRWLNDLTYVRTSFCKNLHAKCYLSEDLCIITSLNLYEFSQINNNEMGILLRRDDDADLYRDAYEEAQRIIRISDEVRISMERIEQGTAAAIADHKPSAQSSATPRPSAAAATAPKSAAAQGQEKSGEKLSTSKLAASLKLKTKELLEKLTEQGFLDFSDEKHTLTPKGKAAGGELRNSQYGPYFIWPADFHLNG